MHRPMDTCRSIWALGWRPGLFLLMSVFLAGDLADDIARKTSATHLSFDVLTLSIAILASVGTGWQSWRALRCAREVAESPAALSGSSPGPYP